MVLPSKFPVFQQFTFVKLILLSNQRQRTPGKLARDDRSAFNIKNGFKLPVNCVGMQSSINSPITIPKNRLNSGIPVSGPFENLIPLTRLSYFSSCHMDT